MITDFHSLAVHRKRWIKEGHKNVPNPLCCCGYEGRLKRSLKDGYTCPIHIGYYALCHLYLLVFFISLSYYVGSVLKFIGLNKVASYINTRARVFEHMYYDNKTTIHKNKRLHNGC
jgi:hypothetical protein